MTRGIVVVSGAPGTGKSTVAAALAGRLELPLLSLDVIKEALGDVLGPGDERWSDQVGDAAAEVVFRLAASFPAAVTEGWWRRQRRARAIDQFSGCVEVFCRCEPHVAVHRARTRVRSGTRHPIHRDVLNPTVLDELDEIVRTVQPLHLGGPLLEVDTTTTTDLHALIDDVASMLTQ